MSAPDSPSTSTPAPAPAIHIHEDPIFGLHAHTTPDQTAAIQEHFDDEEFDLNIDAAKRLRRDDHDLVIFRFKTLRDLLDETLDNLPLRLQPAPATPPAPAPAAEAPYPPHLLQLIAIGDPVHAASEMPPAYYRDRNITPADIPALRRLFNDPEALYMQDHGGYSPACWARSNALRALVELRAPGTAQLILDDLRTTELTKKDYAYMEPNVEDDVALLPKLGPDVCADVIAELHKYSSTIRDHAARLTEILSELVKRHPELPQLRDTCRDAICRELENHPVNDRGYNGFLIATLLDIKAVEAAPLIEKVYAAGHVDPDICGDWEDVQVDLGLKEPAPVRRSPLRLLTDDGEVSIDPPDFPDSGYQDPIRRAAPKVGRNDPCPCGSGKKYKKCCMDKTA